MKLQEILNKAEEYFYTGSTVFEVAKPDSDIDICVLIDKNSPIYIEALRDYDPNNYGTETVPIYLKEDGNLYNVIFFIDKNLFERWRIATDTLTKLSHKMDLSDKKKRCYLFETIALDLDLKGK